jgi:hypothetical protein
MVDLLVRSHLGQVLRVNTVLREVYIPLAIEIFISSDPPSQLLFRYFLNYVICALYIIL